MLLQDLLVGSGSLWNGWTRTGIMGAAMLFNRLQMITALCSHKRGGTEVLITDARLIRILFKGDVCGQFSFVTTSFTTLAITSQLQ